MSDLTNALESLAQNIPSGTHDHLSKSTIYRWQRIFAFNRAQAEEALEKHYNDLSRLTVSDELWTIVREEQEALGHDKESYAFSLSRQREEPHLNLPTHETAVTKKKCVSTEKKRWLFKLCLPLNSTEKIRDVAHMTQPLEILVDEQDRTAQFVQINTAVKKSIEAYLKPVMPTFIALRGTAEKQLSETCFAPSLSIDATLPQYRLDTTPRPLQNEYPIPYFFYGTLAEPERLVAMLGLDDEPVLKPAIVRGGRLRTWAGKYRALVNGGENEVVHGWMYIVENEKHEDALRHYEGGNYEVVRCKIAVGGESVHGLTFRACGDEILC